MRTRLRAKGSGVVPCCEPSVNRSKRRIWDQASASPPAGAELRTSVNRSKRRIWDQEARRGSGHSLVLYLGAWPI